MMTSGTAATLFARLTATAAVLAALALPARADDFYRGKTITLTLGYVVGGGADMYARLLARHISRHIPGQPTVIVQNMPGAASLTALRHQDLIAPKDGTVITLFDFVQINNSMFDPAKTGVDIRSLNWIGSVSEDLSVCYVWHARGIATLDALRRSGPVHMGMTQAGGANDIRLKVMRRLLNVDVKPVSGYPGTAQQFVAIERGELDAACGGYSSLPTNWRVNNLINVLVRLVPTQTANMPKGVPYAGELVATDHERRVLKLLTNPAQLGKPVVAARGVPADRVAILRTAFEATMRDPELHADADRLKVDISPRNAAEASAIIEEIFSMPKDVVEAAKKVIAD
jgi:tripartite-type tricarboxylate transporter receptor subunit TctC